MATKQKKNEKLKVSTARDHSRNRTFDLSGAEIRMIFHGQCLKFLGHLGALNLRHYPDPCSSSFESTLPPNPPYPTRLTPPTLDCPMLPLSPSFILDEQTEIGIIESSKVSELVYTRNKHRGEWPVIHICTYAKPIGSLTKRFLRRQGIQISRNPN